MGTLITLCFFFSFSKQDNTPLSLSGILVLFTHERTGFQKTDKLLDRFIHNAIQTGIFATIFSMGALFALAFAPSTNLYAIFIIPLGRIYTHVSIVNEKPAVH